MGAPSWITALLDDLALVGSLAASIFVKNPAHQQTAAKIIGAVGQVLQQVEPQIQAVSPASPATPATSDAHVATPAN